MLAANPKIIKHDRHKKSESWMRRKGRALRNNYSSCPNVFSQDPKSKKSEKKALAPVSVITGKLASIGKFCESDFKVNGAKPMQLSGDIDDEIERQIGFSPRNMENRTPPRTPPRTPFSEIMEQEPRTPRAPRRHTGKKSLRGAILQHDKGMIRNCLDNFDGDTNVKISFPASSGETLFSLSPKRRSKLPDFLLQQEDFEASERLFPLLYAAKHSTPEVVEELLVGGAFVDAKNSRGQNALHMLSLQAGLDFFNDSPKDKEVSQFFHTTEELSIFQKSPVVECAGISDWLNSTENRSELWTDNSGSTSRPFDRLINFLNEGNEDGKQMSNISIEEEATTAGTAGLTSAPNSPELSAVQISILSSDEDEGRLTIQRGRTTEPSPAEKSADKSDLELRQEELQLTAQLLIEHGIDFQAIDCNGKEPAFYARIFGHANVLREVEKAIACAKRKAFDDLFIVRTPPLETKSSVFTEESGLTKEIDEPNPEEHFYDRCQTPTVRKRDRRFVKGKMEATDNYQINLSPMNGMMNSLSSPFGVMESNHGESTPFTPMMPKKNDADSWVTSPGTSKIANKKGNRRGNPEMSCSTIAENLLPSKKRLDVTPKKSPEISDPSELEDPRHRFLVDFLQPCRQRVQCILQNSPSHLTTLEESPNLMSGGRDPVTPLVATPQSITADFIGELSLPTSSRASKRRRGSRFAIEGEVSDAEF